MSSPVTFVSRRFRHHAGHSGYDRILEYLPGEIVHGERLARWTRRLPDRLFVWTKRGGTDELYGRAGALRETEAAFSFLFTRRRIFHFLYADNDYRLFGRLPNWHEHARVATFHRPAPVLARCFPDPASLRSLDRVILLGESQREFFRGVIDDSRIVVVPHGIDTAFFTPGRSEREPILLFVGHYLRDLETLGAAAALLRKEAPGARLLAVTRPHLAPRLSAIPGFEVRAGISDEELRDLYRRSSLLFLPLRDAVANNSILEALACGLPVVTTRVGSVPEYVDPDCARLARAGDAAGLVAAARGLLDDPAAHARASTAARRLAVERFDLRAIASRTGKVLDEVGLA